MTTRRRQKIGKCSPIRAIFGEVVLRREVPFVMVDWHLFLTVAAPILTLFVGAWVNRRFESRPRLLSHFGHVSSFKFTQDNGDPGAVNAHSVVIRNVGRRPATNVRLSHSHLPDFNVWPRVPYRVEEVPDSGFDIVFPIVIPDQYLQISYLYFPPYTFTDINAGVKSDEGYATEIPVLLQQQFPRWYSYAAGVLMLVGLCTLGYGLFELGLWIVEALPSRG